MIRKRLRLNGKEGTRLRACGRAEVGGRREERERYEKASDADDVRRGLSATGSEPERFQGRHGSELEETLLQVTMKLDAGWWESSDSAWDQSVACGRS